MNILQVIPQLDAGGAERTTLEVAEAVVRAGGRALVVSQGGRMEEELAACGGELFHMPAASKNPLTLWRNMARMAELIRAQDVDLVHARSRAPAWSAKWAAARTGVPYVTTYHGTYNAKSGLKRTYNAIMAKGVRVIANSEFIRDHVLAEHGIDPGRITVIPRGVDLDRFSAAAVPRERKLALLKLWRIEPDCKRLIALLPARLTRWKGQRLTIDAMAALKQRRPDDIPLVIFAGDHQGREAYVAELRTAISAAGLTDDIHLVGHCSDMPAALAVSDLALTPSVEAEAFGRSAAEAGAMGVPVIAADHGGAREVVKEGETGFRVAPGDALALAGGIEKVVDMSKEARKRMGEAARTRIASRFSVTALQDATLRVYHEVLDSRP